MTASAKTSADVCAGGVDAGAVAGVTAGAVGIAADRDPLGT